MKRTAKEIARQHTYDESNTVGIAGTVSPQYRHFEELLKIASTPELFKLAGDDRRAVVRVYALKALKAKGIKIPSPLVAKFSRDFARVQTLDGCIGGEETVSALAGKILEEKDRLAGPLQSLN